MEAVVSRRKSIVIIVSTFIGLLVIGSVVGYAFFWNQYDDASSSEKKAAVLEDEMIVKPNDLNNKLNLAWTYYEQGEYERAKELFEELQKQNAASYDVLFGLANVYVGLENYKDAEKLLLKLQVSYPNDEQVLHSLGIVQREQGRYEEAVKSLQKGLAISKVSADMHYDLALVYEKMKNKEAAIKHFQKCIDFIPDFVEAREGLKRLGIPNYEPVKFHQ